MKYSSVSFLLEIIYTEESTVKRDGYNLVSLLTRVVCTSRCVPGVLSYRYRPLNVTSVAQSTVRYKEDLWRSLATLKY